MTAQQIQDLSSLDIMDLNWDDNDQAFDSIKKLYKIIHVKATSAYQWYFEKRKKIKTIAQWLRGLAAFFAAAAFLPPAFALVFKDLQSEFGYLFFVAAGSCLVVNKALGLSTGWIRYINTGFAISKALDEFQFNWAESMAHLGSHKPTKSEIESLMSTLHEFNNTINNLVESETELWASQFNESLSQLEQVINRRTQQTAQTQKPKKDKSKTETKFEVKSGAIGTLESQSIEKKSNKKLDKDKGVVKELVEN